MKKLVKFLCIVASILMVSTCFASCGGDGASESKSEQATETTKSAEMKIEDIDWKADDGIVDGEHYVMLTYTNNSNFAITNFKLSYKEKSGITPEQKTKFCEDIKTLMKVDLNDSYQAQAYEKLKTDPISVSCKSEMLCRSGETVSNQKFHYYDGYTYLKNVEHFNLTEPDIATIKYVDNNIIYTVNYDFKSKKYTKDSKTEIANFWTEKAIGTAIPKAKADVITCDFDRDDNFSVDVYGWTIADFNSYVKECQTQGYTANKSEYEGYYSADNGKGYAIRLNYNENDMSASIRVEAKDTTSAQ